MTQKAEVEEDTPLLPGAGSDSAAEPSCSYPPSSNLGSSLAHLQQHVSYDVVPEDVEVPGSRQLPAGPRMCRFCLGEEGEDPELGKLLTPCLCRDTVHHECLKRWRATSTQAFYSCGVCKWKYRFKHVSPLKEFWIRLMVPLWPLTCMLLLAVVLGFIPIFGDAEGDIGLHMLNGLSVLGLLYLLIIASVFNFQYCRLNIMATRQAALQLGMATLPFMISMQLVIFVALRCLLVALVFGFCMVYFFPFSGFMGVIAMVMASPPALKEVGDRLVRRLEFDQPVMEVTPEMLTQNAAEKAAADAAAAAAAAAASPAADVEAARQEVGGQQHWQSVPTVPLVAAECVAGSSVGPQHQKLSEAAGQSTSGLAAVAPTDSQPRQEAQLSMAQAGVPTPSETFYAASSSSRSSSGCSSPRVHSQHGQLQQQSSACSSSGGHPSDSPGHVSLDMSRLGATHTS